MTKAEWVNRVLELAGVEPPAERWNTWADAHARACQIVEQAGMRSLTDGRELYPSVREERDAGRLAEPPLKEG